ncbi:hypothetical protein IM711_12640 [Microbacterium esteraromaticum]|uniref:hypothetical protein n=1 Tax=Microbacterium esteraromaticum TaxID=57043 RepID=UPI0015CA10E4
MILREERVSATQLAQLSIGGLPRAVAVPGAGGTDRILPRRAWLIWKPGAMCLIVATFS